MRIVFALLLVPIFVLGCRDLIDEESLRFGSAHELGRLNPYPFAISDAGKPFTLQFADRTLWVFGREAVSSYENDSEELTTRFLELSNGFNVAAWYPTGMVPLNGDLEFLLNDNAEPRDFLELNSDEQEYNDSAILGQIILWPIGGTVFNETGYVFYNKVIYVNEDSIHVAGTGVAEVSPSGETNRIESNLNPYEPTLFWDKKEFGWGEVSVLENDTLFVYRRAPDYLTYLACVPAGSIGDISQYSYYLDSHHWSSTSDDANSFNVYGYLSFDISPNEYLGHYIAILDNYENVLMQKMWDPLSWPSGWYPMFDILYSLRSVQLHPSLNQRGDQVVFVSYNTLWNYSDSIYRRSYTYFVAFDLEF